MALYYMFLLLKHHQGHYAHCLSVQWKGSHKGGHSRGWAARSCPQRRTDTYNFTFHLIIIVCLQFHPFQVVQSSYYFFHHQSRDFLRLFFFLTVDCPAFVSPISFSFQVCFFTLLSTCFCHQYRLSKKEVKFLILGMAKNIFIQPLLDSTFGYMQNSMLKIIFLNDLKVLFPLIFDFLAFEKWNVFAKFRIYFICYFPQARNRISILGSLLSP